MFVCRNCRSETELDDVMVRFRDSDRVICEACVDRQSGDQRHVSKTLQREINSETPMTKIESDHETVAMERPRS